MNRRILATVVLSAWLAYIPSESTSAAVSPGDTLRLSADTPRVVAKKIELRELSIPEGAVVRAVEGQSLTMTVNGVESAIEPGTYRGRIVLTPTHDILVRSASVAAHFFRTAVHIDGGKLMQASSVSSAVSRGSVTDTEATNVKIRSNGENFNGIIVSGDSRYVINNADIDLTGNGGDDTDGFGAGILSSGRAEVVVNKAKLVTKGAIRTAIFVAGASTMRINDSSIEVFSGKLPPGYQFNIGDGRVMMEVPWMLGLVGNVRATNVVENGTIYFERSKIKSHGWGALSTDGVKQVRMYAKDSVIETVGSGYGAYALEDSIDSFSHCRFDVDDYALIIAGNGSGLFSDGTRVKSRRFGVMMHQGNGGNLLIDKGSSFDTRSTLIQVKGRGTTIVVDDAKLRAGNGILLQTMENDDPFLKAMAARRKAQPAPVSAPPVRKGAGSGDVSATFSRVQLVGDLVHAMTNLGELRVALKRDASIRGAITAATASPSTGKEPTQATYYSIGDVKNEYGPTTGAYGVNVSLESGSTWVVDTTSFLTALSIADGSALKTAGRRKLALIVNGVETKVVPGRYAGQIELRVSPEG